jgi:hypothetical protein
MMDTGYSSPLRHSKQFHDCVSYDVRCRNVFVVATRSAIWPAEARSKCGVFRLLSSFVSARTGMYLFGCTDALTCKLFRNSNL